jgi:hypothetical protein
MKCQISQKWLYILQDKAGGSHYGLKKSLKVMGNSHSTRRRRERGERGYKWGKCRRGK